MQKPYPATDTFQPRIFISSSVEGLPVARAIQEKLRRHKADCYLWSDPGIFEVSEVTIESLVKALDLFSYAIVVLTPDDLVSRRSVQKAIPRDNLVFELGLFVGRHGRDSAFMVAPERQEILLPSNLFGVQTAYYSFTGSGKGRARPDVGSACTHILRAVRAAEKRRSRSRVSSHEEARFWDALADVVLVIFGVELAGEDQPGRHPRISLRDLDAAQAVTSFLLRRNPSRRVLMFPTTARGWEGLLQADPDLILIGGGFTNPEFARHRHRFGRDFRLKMGRLCRVSDQAVYHIGFGRLPKGTAAPPRQNSRAINDFASEHVTRDFGFVYSGREEIYGAERRVITISGVKGNGTRGAALCLTQASTHRKVLNPLLSGKIGPDDPLEMVVRVDVFNDVIGTAEVIEIRAAGLPVFDASAGFSEPCELGIACATCRFGEQDALASSPVEALLFDLDDTLVDTYGTLIEPLEAGASHRMCTEDPGLPSARELTAFLLELRRSHPDQVEDKLRCRFPGLREEALAARRKLLTSVPIDQLGIVPAVRDLLGKLRRGYRIYLLTAGEREFQEAKIQTLGLRDVFDEIVIVSSGSEADKEAAIASFLVRHGHSAGKMVVIGNRLDKEIRSGNRLRLPTVWLRRGEGSGLVPGEATGIPDHVITDILDLPGILDKLSPASTIPS